MIVILAMIAGLATYIYQNHYLPNYEIKDLNGVRMRKMMESRNRQQVRLHVYSQIFQTCEVSSLEAMPSPSSVLLPCLKPSSTQQDYSRHSLTRVPPSVLKNAASLEELDLCDNCLAELPLSLFSLQR